jgi:hypothetical protein
MVVRWFRRAVEFLEGAAAKAPPVFRLGAGLFTGFFAGCFFAAAAACWLGMTMVSA